MGLSRLFRPLIVTPGSLTEPETTGASPLTRQWRCEVPQAYRRSSEPTPALRVWPDPSCLLSNGETKGVHLEPVKKRLNPVMLLVFLVFVVGSAPAKAANAAAGKAIYTAKCQACHAADGSGNPGLGKALGVTWQPLGGPDIQKMSDDDLKKVVTAGKGKMKPVSGLAGADLDNVVAYVRTLKK